MEILTATELQERAPSIFSAHPAVKMTEQYRFVPTIQVVEALQDSGFYPVMAAQTRTRVAGKGEYCRHVVRLRRMEDMLTTGRLGEDIPEVVLVNSHDGSTAYKLMMGIFRVVCSNGLIVQSSSFGEIATRHTGDKSLCQQVIDASFKIVEEAPAVMTGIATWKSIELSKEQQHAYARAAEVLRDSPIHLSEGELLGARRYADNQPNLWNTFNNVQENIMKGGQRGLNATGKHIKTRSINSVKHDIALNRALWSLTEEMAKLATTK